MRGLLWLITVVLLTTAASCLGFGLTENGTGGSSGFAFNAARLVGAAGILTLMGALYATGYRADQHQRELDEDMEIWEE